MEHSLKMTKKEITFRDPVVERVCDKFVERSDVGFKKYKQTLDTERKTGVKDLSAYLNDVQEELMDAILYIQAAREELAETFELVPSFSFKNKSYERQANSKGEFKERGGKQIRAITYTPDFVGRGFIIECKGRPNESFPIRWKLFKRYISKNLPNVTLYKPQNQKECDEIVSLILGKRKT
jgi:hypothetical protein